MFSRNKIDISTGAILRTAIVILAIWFLYSVRHIVALFFISFILSSALEPLVDRLGKKRIPRPVSVLSVYAVILLVLALLFSFLIPSIFHQISDLSQNLPEYGKKISEIFSWVEKFLTMQGVALDNGEIARDLGDSLAQYTSGLFASTLNIFYFFASIAIVMSMTFYMSVKENGTEVFLISITPREHQEYIISLSRRIKNKISNWIAGQLFLMLIIFCMYFIALYLIGVPYALILALLAGLFEIIPYLGPLISAVPGVLLGFLISPFTGLMVIISFVLIQQIENHIIVPQVMKKAVGLNPLTIILSLLIGAKLAGFFGVILAVPVATAIGVFVGDLMNKKKEGEFSLAENIAQQKT